MDPTQNNGFGNQVPVNMGYSGVPMSTGGAGGAGGTGGAGTGDIILAPEKKSKKWWIVGGVVGVVALCGVIIAVSMNTGQTGDSKSDAVNGLVINNYSEALNAYANYALFGEYSTDEIDDSYDPGILYSIWRAAREGNVGYFQSAKRLFDNVWNWVNNENELNDDIDYVLLEGYKDEFDFYCLYNTFNDATPEEVLDKYLDVGKEATVAWIDEMYGVSNNYSGLSKVFLDLRKKDDLLDLDIVSKAERHGCLKEKELDHNCLGEKGETELFLEKERIKRRIDAMFYDARDGVVIDCFALIKVKREGGISYLRSNKGLKYEV